MYRFDDSYGFVHPNRLTERQRRFMVIWEEKRKEPRWYYFLINGFFKQILWIFLFLKGLQFILLTDASSAFYTSGEGAGFLLFEIIFWAVCGLALGWLKYLRNESQYELYASMRHF